MSEMGADLSSIDVAVLAGGLGTRLRKVVADKPKVLAPLDGRPFLAYLLDFLQTAGLEHVILCTGYLGDQVEAVFGNKYNHLYLDYSRETKPLGTAGALEHALPFIETETVLVTNGDSFCNADLSAMWEAHCQRQAKATILLVEVDDTSRYGRVCLGADDEINGFEEKNGSGGPGLVNAGIYLLDRDLLKTIPSGRNTSLERDVFPQWIGRGFYGYQAKGRFIDIGTEASYLTAERFFA
ncbi:MAG: nucleotidyltransferase family protein [Myxococcota bacterium]|nr:nucleotidyltransferase family protein [Myxococcota bacterium]